MSSFVRWFPWCHRASPVRSASRDRSPARSPRLETLEDRTTPAGYGVLGAPFVVHENSAGNQRDSDIAVAGDGRGVVVWEAGGDVFARYLSVNGSLGLPEFLVHTAVSGAAAKPKVASNGNRWVVAYEVENAGDRNIQFRTFLDGSTSLNTGGEAATFGLDQQQTLPDVDMAADGSFVIVWNHSVNSSGMNLDVRGRRFNVNGLPIGADFAIAGANTTERELAPKVAVNSLDARFAVTWVVETAGMFSPTVPKASIYLITNGTAQPAVVGQNLATEVGAGDRGILANVAGDDTGNFMFVWNRTRGDNGDHELRRRFVDVNLAFAADTNEYETLGETELFKIAGVDGGVDVRDSYIITYVYESRVRGRVKLQTTDWEHVALNDSVNANGDPSVSLSGRRFVTSFTLPGTGGGGGDIGARNWGVIADAGPRGAGLRGYVDSTGQLWAAQSIHGQGSPLSTVLMANLSKAVTWTDFNTLSVNNLSASPSGSEQVVARVVETGEWWQFRFGSATPRGQWNPGAGWVDVRTMSLGNPFWNSIVGRTATGQWWASVEASPGVFQNVLLGAWNPNAGWRDVLIGDFNGDNRQDIAGRTASGQWWVGVSNGSAIATTLWGAWNEAADWRDVKVGDFNGDGRDDIIGRTASGQWWLARSNGAGFVMSPHATWSGTAVWVNVNVGDFNGDGVADLAGRVQSSGIWYITLSPKGSGATTTDVAGVWSPGVNWGQVVVGDFNRDGRSDIMGRDAASGIWWCNLTKPSSELGSRRMLFQTIQWGVWSPSVTWSRVASGNFPG